MFRAVILASALVVLAGLSNAAPVPLPEGVGLIGDWGKTPYTDAPDTVDKVEILTYDYTIGEPLPGVPFTDSAGVVTTLTATDASDELLTWYGWKSEGNEYYPNSVEMKGNGVPGPVTHKQVSSLL